MAERITTARPYAKAIFALARKGNTLAATSAGLMRAAEVVADPRVHALLGSPHVTPAQLAELVTGVVGAGLDENSRNFVSLLAQNRRLGFLPEIAALFEQMKAERGERGGCRSDRGDRSSRPTRKAATRPHCRRSSGAACACIPRSTAASLAAPSSRPAIW